jgi:hypothetical protein
MRFRSRKYRNGMWNVEWFCCLVATLVGSLGVWGEAGRSLSTSALLLPRSRVSCRCLSIGLWLAYAPLYPKGHNGGCPVDSVVHFVRRPLFNAINNALHWRKLTLKVVAVVMYPSFALARSDAVAVSLEKAVCSRAGLF